MSKRRKRAPSKQWGAAGAALLSEQPRSYLPTAKPPPTRPKRPVQAQERPSWWQAVVNPVSAAFEKAERSRRL
jgi:hypothetical protein